MTVATPLRERGPRGTAWYDPRARRVDARLGRGLWRVESVLGELLTFRYWQSVGGRIWHATTVTFTMTRREFWR